MIKKNWGNTLAGFRLGGGQAGWVPWWSRERELCSIPTDTLGVLPGNLGINMQAVDERVGK